MLNCTSQVNTRDKKRIYMRGKRTEDICSFTVSSRETSVNRRLNKKVEGKRRPKLDEFQRNFGPFGANPRTLSGTTPRLGGNEGEGLMTNQSGIRR